MALSDKTFGDIGTGISDIFSGIGLQYKAKGSRLEAQTYDKAAALARLNEQFAVSSTSIKEFQQQRDAYKQIGQQQADVAAGGASTTGSALDILRESASQAALEKSVISQQGLIEEASYKEQAESYDLMAEASRMAAKADDWGAVGKFIGAAVSFGAAAATL